VGWLGRIRAAMGHVPKKQPSHQPHDPSLCVATSF
jgi:hypothetical protein